jgi:hypothetical protein
MANTGKKRPEGGKKDGFKSLEVSAFFTSFVRPVQQTSNAVPQSLGSTVTAAQITTFTVSALPGNPQQGGTVTAVVLNQNDGTSIPNASVVVAALPTANPTGPLWRITIAANALTGGVPYTLRVVLNNTISCEVDFSAQ